MNQNLEKIEKIKMVIGNTSQSPVKVNKKQINQSKYWCFTFNNYLEKDISDLETCFRENSSKYIFESEIGEKGTKHLQGYIALKKKGRPSELNLSKSIHWEKCKGNEDSNIKYCSKDYRAKVNDCKLYKSDNIKLLVDRPKVKIIDELRPFQKSILNILDSNVNEGKVIWICDTQGQLGKTQLLRYLHVTKGCPFTYGGKANDIINLVFNNKDYLLDNDKAVMIYNLPRETDNEKISYKSMEQINDGAISNTKFETGCFVCNPPHVLVLANCMPLMEKMTKGRFIIYTISKELELIEFGKKL